MKLTSAYRQISQMTSRVKVVQGGTSAGKTYSILQDWILAAAHEGHPRHEEFDGISSICAESIPHLKRGAMRDFFTILKNENLYDEIYHNKTERMYQIGKATFEFFPADDASKQRGARRKNLFLNEANNMVKDVFDQLEVRTEHGIWLDFNPVAEFWGHHLHEDKAFETEFVKLTYLDNEALSENIVRSIESRKGENMWWKVYGLGEIGTVEGVILRDWEPIDKVPEDAELLATGLDFGFSNDPTVAVTLYRYDGEVIADELFCATGLSNRDIADQLGAYNTGTVYCDSAEPKSIAEIRKYGLPVHAARKGKDSVRFGIDLMQQYRIRPTQDSTNLIKSLRNYSWRQTRDGSWMNIPDHNWSDPIDAMRYAFVMRLGNKHAVYNVI